MRALECQSFHWMTSRAPAPPKRPRLGLEGGSQLASSGERRPVGSRCIQCPFGFTSTLGASYCGRCLRFRAGGRASAFASSGHSRAVAGSGASSSWLGLQGASLLANSGVPRLVGSKGMQCPFGTTSTLGASYCAACLVSKAVQPVVKPAVRQRSGVQARSVREATQRSTQQLLRMSPIGFDRLAHCDGACDAIARRRGAGTVKQIGVRGRI